MLTFKKVVFAFMFMILATTVQGQDEKLPSYFSNEELQLNNLNIVGDFSYDFKTKSKEVISTISLKQIGDENIAKIDDRASLGKHKVYQIGDRNNYQFINYRNTMSIDLGILQTGNENSLRIQGTNSIFKNLKIAQFGGARMSIINY